MAGNERSERMGCRMGGRETQQEDWTIGPEVPGRKCTPGFGVQHSCDEHSCDEHPVLQAGSQTGP